MASKAHRREIPDTSTYSLRMQEIIHSLRLEGITLSEESLDDLKQVDEGTLSSEEALNRVLARVKSKKN